MSIGENLRDQIGPFATIGFVKQPLENIGPVQRLVRDRAKATKQSLTKLSLGINRNRTYLQQFITKGTPTKLDEDDRRKLAPLIGVDEKALRHPGAPRRADTASDAGDSGVVASGLAPRPVPIVGEVAAGLWVEVFDDEPQDAREFVYVAVPGYERVRLQAWRVRGPSMNRKYVEGSFVITCSVVDGGVRHNDDVVVMRRSSGRVEFTIKEVVVDADETWLTPRSTDPKFQKPWKLERNIDGQDGLEIVQVVIADMKIKSRPAGPLPHVPGWDD